MTVPLPSGPAGSRVGAAIHDVVCLSVRNCWAVGSWGYEVGSTVGASYLSEHWNGSAWHYVAAALPASAVGSPLEPALEGMSCISGTDCWAVGSAGGAPSASHWDGHRWTVRAVQALPGPDAGAVLFDVSCAGFDCWAVGTGHGYQFGVGGGSSSSYVVLHLVKGTGSRSAHRSSRSRRWKTRFTSLARHAIPAGSQEPATTPRRTTHIRG
jgi:hypothetical protein